MKIITKQQKKNAKSKSNLGFKKGMLGSLFQRKKQTSRKEKTKKETPTKSLFQEGVDGQKAKKEIGILKGKTRKGKKTEKEDKKHFKTGLLGEQNRQKTSKIGGKYPFWAFLQNKSTKTQATKTKPPKTKKQTTKNTFLHFGKQPPIFGNFFFASYTLSSLQSCVLLKTL